MKLFVKRKFILVIFLFFFLSNFSIAQSYQPSGSLLPTVFPPSPEAESIAKYGNYEVSLFTGLPQINIPLYTIKAGELEVPISISYHASGIKVTEMESCVGLGWTLNTGGGNNKTGTGIGRRNVRRLFS